MSLIEIVPEVARFAPLFVIIARPPGQNAWQGWIENSFSMDWSSERVRLWWSGTAYSIIGEMQINGEEDASDHLDTLLKDYPDWDIVAWNIHDELCPIRIDLRVWLEDMAAGSRRKFENRNPKFELVGG